MLRMVAKQQAWKLASYPGHTPSLEVFAGADNMSDGIPILQITITARLHDSVALKGTENKHMLSYGPLLYLSALLHYTPSILPLCLL